MYNMHRMSLSLVPNTLLIDWYISFWLAISAVAQNRDELNANFAKSIK